MITLYKKRNSEFGNEVDQKLNDLVISYETEELPEEIETEVFIIESEKKIKGKQAIEEWLYQLEDELRWQRSLSGDACYLDPDTGETC